MTNTISKSMALMMVLVAVFAVSGCFVITGEQPQGDVIVLFTNDVHCGINDNIGYAGLAAYKKSVEASGNYVTLVDCGDNIQGDVVGSVTSGYVPVQLMNYMGYDYAVLGNHEFDYGMDQLEFLMNEADAEYLGCNVRYTGEGTSGVVENLLPYDIKEYGEISIAYVVVSTPETIGMTTPTHFMDENGNYVYDFYDTDSQEFYSRVQSVVTEVRSAGADYVVVLSHLGDAEESAPFSSIDLARYTEGIDAILDGHAHNVISCRIEANLHGEDVLISSTGTKMANIGQLVITGEGTISVGLISHYTNKDSATQDYIDMLMADFEEMLNTVVAYSDFTLADSDENGARLVRNRETTIGNLCADAYRAVTGADIAFVNGGGVRASLEAGDVTYSDMISVHPFGNMLCMVTATGAEIVDALEMGARYTQAVAAEGNYSIGENGGFFHVSGLKYEIDTSVESTVIVDEYDTFVGVSGERRVKNVMVLNDAGEYVPIDLEKEYKFASHNYMIKSGGDGCGMFMDNELLVDEAMLDYQAVITYITEHLGGVIPERYRNVEGRIVVL